MKRFAVAAMLAILPTFAQAQVACYVGGSVGGSVTQTEVPGITIAASGAIAGVEGGCDYKLDKIFIGAFARADFSDVKSSFAGSTIKQDAAWTVGGRLGYSLNPDVNIYGLLGYSGTSIDYASLTSIDRNGITAGAGIEAKLFGNVWGFAEFDHTEYRKWTDLSTGDQLKPSSDVARVGVRVKF